ncbi:MAG TPA: hypothetical protein VGI39_25115 [Polyangiaceae bacterium]|jgi:hypothetical protein
MDLPPLDDLRWIVSQYAQLRAAHGEAIGTPELVEPTGEFFPDAFTPSPEGVAGLLKRLLTYAPVSEHLGWELGFVEAEGGGGGGCSSGACGTGGGGGALIGEAVPHPQGEGYRVQVAVRDVGDPVVLTASLARCVGGMILGEAGEELSGVVEERFATSEIAATLSGFGLLLLNGACVYTKSCGGLRAHQSTRLDVPSCAVALALFLRVHDVKPGLARRHLETTQAEAFDEALRWVDSKPALLEALQTHPESLTSGDFPVEESKGLFGRLFGARKATSPELSPPPAVTRRARSPEEERRLAETKAMVEEALRAR